MPKMETLQLALLAMRPSGEIFTMERTTCFSVPSEVLTTRTTSAQRIFSVLIRARSVLKMEVSIWTWECLDTSNCVLTEIAN